jgi:hypothetical protein
MMRAPFVIVLLTALVTAAVRPASAQDRPRISISSLRQDLGDVFEQATYEYVFVVRNTGEADLVITEVKPGCGCTVANYDKVIAPDREGKITLTLEGDQVHGVFSKDATVRSNDPDRPELMLIIAGNKIPYVNVSPGERVNLQGTYDEAVAQTLTVASNEKDLDFAITGLESDLDDEITYAYEKGTAPGEWVVSIHKNPKLPAQSTYGTLTIHTNSKRAPAKVVQVLVTTRGSITVQPSLLNFGRVRFGDGGKNGDVLEKSVTLVRSQGEFAIRELTIDNENFRAVVVEEVPGKRYKIDVKFTAPVRTRGGQAESGELIIHTNDPREPNVRVQLVARAL